MYTNILLIKVRPLGNLILLFAQILAPLIETHFFLIDFAKLSRIEIKETIDHKDNLNLADFVFFSFNQFYSLINSCFFSNQGQIFGD